jgi:hypothetical protein
MTPKEKAKELYLKFYSKIPSIQDEGQMQDEASKQCALIAVDEMISEAARMKSSYMGRKRYEYLQEVKKEIEKL